MTADFPKEVDFLIVGAGFAGAVLAERLASQTGSTCLIVDKRAHIAGNAYDYKDAAGVLVHKYGPHYFRTNSERIITYLNQFTEWLPVSYEIASFVEGRHWPFPINLNTFEQLVGRLSTQQEMEETLERWRVPITHPANSEEIIVSQVGWKLYEMFFKNYTRKQWRREPKDLDASVCGRIPIRTSRDNRFVSEKFQAMPKNGYTALFERMLNHPKIQVHLRTDFREVRGSIRYKHLIYTGMIDEYYGFRFGPLPYRSLRFENETHDTEYFQPYVQVNYPNDHDFTRIVEIKHVTGQKLPVTTITREYPEDFGPGKEAYYPIPAPDTRVIHSRYAELAVQEENVSFVGRLATYRYYNMDQVIGMALAAFEKIRNRVNPVDA